MQLIGKGRYTICILAIEQRLDENNFKPKTLYSDAGFINGKSILKSTEAGIDLAGPSSGRAQSFEGFESEERPFDIKDFTVEINDISKEIKVISCPNGQEVIDQERSKKTGKVIVHFNSSICRECSFQERCPVKLGVHKSTLHVTEDQYAGAARHHKYMGNIEYRKECGIRVGAESLVNEVANAHGARKSKYKTEGSSRLQLIMVSLSCNIKRYIRTVQSCAKKQPELAN